MKIFLSWSQPVSKEIASKFREWLPMVNHHLQPYMSEDDVEKGSHWPTQIREELDAASFGLVMLTPENIGSIWLYFEAGAIAKAVEKSRLAPVLFELKPSDVPQPLSLFQTTLFNSDDMMRLVRSVNSAMATEHARDDRSLETTFQQLWPKLEAEVKPLVERLGAPKAFAKERSETNKILQELLTLARQQVRILSNPEELVGRQVLSLMHQLVNDVEGAATRLTTRERTLALAQCARWMALSSEIRSYVEAQSDSISKKQVLRQLNQFRVYLTEFENMLTLSGSAVGSPKAPGKPEEPHEIEF